jgi:pimeloyl-ACP methyl ester carboxylesterase
MLTIVLVHGAFADASSWKGVVERLQKEGHTVVAPANPLRRPGRRYGVHRERRRPHRVIEGGVGHNLPQEAPQAFNDAIIEVDTY